VARPRRGTVLPNHRRRCEAAGSDDEGLDEVNSAGATSELLCNFNF
jgi:hypothetical protein